MTTFHHVELWLADPASELPAWRWLLAEIGLRRIAEWDDGVSWETEDGPYLTLTASPNTHGEHDRRRPGVNHLAFSLESTAAVDTAMRLAPEHGWRPLYHERYPHAGGPDHYAGWLENARGYKVELVAVVPSGKAIEGADGAARCPRYRPLAAWPASAPDQRRLESGTDPGVVGPCPTPLDHEPAGGVDESVPLPRPTPGPD